MSILEVSMLLVLSHIVVIGRDERSCFFGVACANKVCSIGTKSISVNTLFYWER